MKKPAIRRSRASGTGRTRERGVTMILVALAMVAIIGMAALSIDVITLYLAKEEAQRSADNAALAAAKVISLSGITGDPSNATGNWQKICGPDDGTNGVAARAAKAVSGQDPVAGLAATTINVTYSAGTGGTVGTGTADCSTLASTAFGVNPMVSVQVIRASLPTFFSRIWGNTGNTISATATAEAFNPSNSSNVGNQTTGSITPVEPRCVKPWVVPNLDPLSVVGCTGNCTKFVNNTNGQIMRPGISIGGAGGSGVIGETFWLVADCSSLFPGFCHLYTSYPQPFANASAQPPFIPPPPNLMYVPGQVGTPVIALPSCPSGTGDQFEQAIEGCDQPTNYSCGTPPASSPNPNAVDLTEYPIPSTVAGAQCLTRQSDTTNFTSSSGQDYLNTFAAPASFPFQILAGSSNPTGLNGAPVSISSSIVNIPIYDNTTNVTDNTRTEVTFVGFLQVFINAVDGYGNLNVTVLNVSGCGNGTGDPVGAPVIGNSPVPVRLITPP